jgi:hypothetical protein
LSEGLAQSCGMTPLVYRCPDKGMKVQTWFADEPSEREVDIERLETVHCLVCARRHLINFKTGEVIAEGAE